MDDVTKTDKMLSRKDGNVGYVIFNNPERHNAVSLEMWSRTAEILDEFARDDECVEVTPEIVCIRKVNLDQTERARATSRLKRQDAGV